MGLPESFTRQLYSVLSTIMAVNKKRFTVIAEYGVPFFGEVADRTVFVLEPVFNLKRFYD